MGCIDRVVEINDPAEQGLSQYLYRSLYSWRLQPIRWNQLAKAIALEMLEIA
jgi:hypothetical protein